VQYVRQTRTNYSYVISLFAHHFSCPGITVGGTCLYKCSLIQQLSSLMTSNLVRHVSFMRICDCRIFRLLPHFSQILAKCAYRIFSRLNWHFDGNFNIICVLPISTRFCYLDHLVANRMTPSMCPELRTPMERDGVVGFKQFRTIFPHIQYILRRIFGVYAVRILL